MAPWAWSQQPTPTPSPCPLNSNWVPTLVNYTASGAALPTQDTAGSNTSFCAFHQWSWEAFVWATALDDNKQPRFLGLQSLDNLGQPTSPAAAKSGKPTTKQLVLKPRTQKASHSEQAITAAASGLEIPSADQATSGILVDQNGQAVFYSEHANSTYYDFAQKYYGIANYNAAPKDLNFPVGSVVFKASWRIVDAGEDTSTFFITQATVPLLVPVPASPPQYPFASVTTSTDPKATRQVTVALVGLHVVGVTVNHPEFLWGSFEHVRNAPDLPRGLSPNQPVSSQNFTFYKAGTPVNQCNIQVDGRNAALVIVDKGAQTLSPVTNVFRRFSHGNTTSEQVQEIDALNVAAQGAAQGFPNGGVVWANYKLIGTLWLDGNTLKPGVDGFTLFRQGVGSVSLANATMETFVQQMCMSCFSCHNTGATKVPPATTKMPGRNIGLSHALGNPFFTSPTPSPTPSK